MKKLLLLALLALSGCSVWDAYRDTMRHAYYPND